MKKLKITSESLGNLLRIIGGSLRTHLEIDRVIGNHLRITQESPWNHLKISLESLRNHLYITWKLLENHLGNRFGISLAVLGYQLKNS